MRKRIIVLSLAFLFFIPLLARGTSNKNVLVVPIDGDINKTTVQFVKESIKFGQDSKVDAIIFKINTYGGMIVAAEEIKNRIVETKVPTISYVDNKAESAGVLIAISSEHIIMNENSTIGSAEPIPNTEKTLSFWRSILRDTALYRGRNTTIIEAMADKDIVISGITEKGKLVNLTSVEAIKLGLIDGRAESIDDVLKYLNMSGANILEYEPGIQMKFVSFISNSIVSSILVMIGMVAFVVEVFTPGFGVAGTLSFTSFTIFFLGNILAGNSNWSALVLFILGLILIVVEVIVPGFGLPGITGIICVVIGLVLAMESIETAAWTLVSSVIATSVVTTILIKNGYKSRLIQRIRLNQSATSDKGYVSVDSTNYKVGDMGIAETDLRPTGFIVINGDRIDALSYEGYIEKSSIVKIEKIEGQKIFVRRK